MCERCDAMEKTLSEEFRAGIDARGKQAAEARAAARNAAYDAFLLTPAGKEYEAARKHAERDINEKSEALKAQLEKTGDVGAFFEAMLTLAEEVDGAERRAREAYRQTEEGRAYEASRQAADQAYLDGQRACRLAVNEECRRVGAPVVFPEVEPGYAPPDEGPAGATVDPAFEVKATPQRLGRGRAARS